MKKRIAVLSGILFLLPFYFSKEKVFASSYSSQNYLVELRPIRGEKYGRYYLFQRGLKKFNNGNYQGSIDIFSKYIIKYSSSGEYDYVDHAYFNRALSKSKIGDHNGAISDYTKAIQMNYEKLSDAYLYRGISKETLGDIKGACFDAKKTVSLGYQSKEVNDWIKNNCKWFK